MCTVQYSTVHYCVVNTVVKGCEDDDDDDDDDDGKERYSNEKTKMKQVVGFIQQLYSTVLASNIRKSTHELRVRK